MVWLATALVLAAVVLVWAGDEFDRPELLNLAGMLGAVAFALVAVRIIVRRRDAQGLDRRRRSTTWRGWSAVLRGIAFLVASVAVGVFFAARLVGFGAELEVGIAARPGLVLVPLSLAVLAFAGSLVLGPEEAGRSGWRRLRGLPGRVGGALLAVVALGGIAAGVVELADPDAYHRGVAALATAARSLADRVLR